MCLRCIKIILYSIELTGGEEYNRNYIKEVHIKYLTFHLYKHTYIRTRFKWLLQSRMYTRVFMRISISVMFAVFGKTVLLPGYANRCLEPSVLICAVSTEHMCMLGLHSPLVLFSYAQGCNSQQHPSLPNHNKTQKSQGTVLSHI